MHPSYLGSLNSVTEMVLFSGTAHTTTPLRGVVIVGSQSRGSVATRRLLLVHTILSLVGVLKNNKKNYLPSVDNLLKKSLLVNTPL